MTFEWQPPEDKGGIELLSYKIYMAKADDTFSQVLSAPSELNPSITVHTEQGLVADQTYKFRVSAVNFVGEGPLSNEIFVIAADMPEKPTIPPTINTVTQTSITLTLTELPEENNGGSPVTGYIVQMDDGLGGEFVTVHDSLYLYLILSGLEQSRFYRIRYAARNIIYDSSNIFECDELQFSDQVVVHTAIEPTTPLTLVHNTALRYRDALIFEWRPPLNDGGSKLQEYHLELLNKETQNVE